MNLRKMIHRFKTAGTLTRQPGQGLKETSQQRVKEVSTTILQ